MLKWAVSDTGRRVRGLPQKAIVLGIVGCHVARPVAAVLVENNKKDDLGDDNGDDDGDDDGDDVVDDDEVS